MEPVADIRRARPLLGTFVEISARAPAPAAEAAVEAAFAAVAMVHWLMSFHAPDSDVSRLNRGAASGPVRVHEWTYEVLEAALDVHHRSGGLFDITVAPALQALGLLPGDAHPPLEGEGRTAEGSPGWGDGASEHVERLPPLPGARTRADLPPPRGDGRANAIQLLPGHHVRYARPGIAIDVGGIAKGFAVDRAVEVLRRHGVTEGLVNAGGDLAAFGPRQHAIDIRDPRQPERPLGRTALANAALASSAGRLDPMLAGAPAGTAVIDPATGMPAAAVLGATVCAPCCVIADALTKVVMNAGESAAAILEHYGASALFVSAQGALHVTADWKNEVRFAA